MSKTKNIFNMPKFGDFEDNEELLNDESPVSPKEFSEEILDIKRNQKAFAATNDHQNYMVVVFSHKEDLQLFQKETELEGTFIDGYELARKMKVNPKKPSIKLPISLDEKYKNRQK